MANIVRLAEHHRTGAFSSDTPLLDGFLRSEAYDEDYGTTWVVVPAPNSQEVIAFYTLNYPYEVGLEDDAILALPAVELTCLAVDSRYQGQGIGTRLLRGLIDRLLNSLDGYPVDLLVLVALSARARSWYLSRGLGFRTAEAPADRMTQYLPVAEMRRLRDKDPQWHEKMDSLPPFPWSPIFSLDDNLQ